MKAYVTGATGFIGRRLVEKLRKDGATVIALVRNNRHGLPDGVQTVLGDILEPDSLRESGLGCDRLYHLAALITFDPRRREELLRVNRDGTVNMLSAARRWNVARTVVVSSACTVGLSHAKHHVLDEDSLLADELTDNPYLESKLAAERAAVMVAGEQMATVVNPTTVFGPGDRTLNSGTLVLKVARSRILPVPPGGSNVVDVDDVGEGILAAGERGQSGRRYILGGENLTFAQIFDIVGRVVGNRPITIPVPGWMRMPMAGAARAAGWICSSRFLTPEIINGVFAYKCYSSRRAQEELSWSPRHSFRESVERAWAFYRQEGFA
ncbi:MAG: NAD-dependent epimerase/dehydratase family protein [Verrucomicrobia bacterium]|nr:NAD-dependent epimerase/dehydratase family protein [Verrucomicrobiota bacterium]